MMRTWWYSGEYGRIKMCTTIPEIAFGQAGLVLHTNTDSPIGQLIGGNSKSDFTAFNVRGVFATAAMAVTGGPVAAAAKKSGPGLARA